MVRTDDLKILDETNIKDSTLEETVKALYNKDKYRVMCTNTSVKVILNEAKEVAVAPLGVASLLPRIQVKLGEDIRDFQKYMVNLDSNFVIIGNSQSRKVETWDFIRLEDGLIPKDKKICSIITVDDIIVNIVYNQKLIDDREFRSIERLPMMNQIVANGRDGMASILIVLSALTCRKLSEFKVIEADNGRLEVKHEEENIKYVFTRTKDRSYTLASIGFNRMI